MKAIIVSILNDTGGKGVTFLKDLISEVYCFGVSEIHNVAIIIGGIVSQ